MSFRSKRHGHCLNRDVSRLGNDRGDTTLLETNVHATANIFQLLFACKNDRHHWVNVELRFKRRELMRARLHEPNHFVHVHLGL